MKRFPLINPQTPQTPQTPLTLALLLAVLGSCGDLGSPTDPGPDPDPAPGTQGGTVLGSGTFTLPGALASGDPGEHEVFLINHDLRPDLEPTSGRRLVVELRDASRATMVCPTDEPEDGCATIDWSGQAEQPGVPEGGLFINRLEVVLRSGPREYYLSRTLRLENVPDLVDPNHEHTAIPGAGRAWSVVLPEDLLGDRNLRLRIVLTKWQPPNLRIAYEIRVAS